MFIFTLRYLYIPVKYNAPLNGFIYEFNIGDLQTIRKTN